MSIEASTIQVSDHKLRTLLSALREAAILVVAALEEALDTPYDRSALAKRRQKVALHGG